MKVPQKLQQTIDQLRSHGDIDEIQKRTGFSRYRISQVFNSDDSSDPDVIVAVAEFFQERKEILSDFLPNEDDRVFS
ncbi:hypothetical protein UFOVP402_56 [uncultured Caudovirales phage]|uniref:Uncharacterized protein n=1 Tax=uncultured Caudovirales phage TaxID=2100421 RepID=A0A6J5M3B6_9CAUD|nr:hypothetical protein UFOVP402_56 [uncultured Caudovirales phage]